MARVTYTDLPVGASAATQLNGIFNAFATESASVDEQNLAEEGLDAGPFESDVQGYRAFDAVTQTTAGTQAQTTTWITLNAGTQMRSGSPASDVASDEKLVLEGFVEVMSDGSNDGVPAGSSAEIRLAISEDSIVGFVNSSVRSVAGQGVPSSGMLETMAVLDGPISVFDWAEIQVRDGSGSNGTLQIGRALLRGRVLRRF